MMRKESLYGPAAILIIWYILYWTRIINPLFLPLPHSVIKEFFSIIIKVDTWKDIGSSFWRVTVSFLIASLIGIPTGLLMGCHIKLYYSFELIVDFFRSLPALAIFPLLMFFFGIGDKVKIATAVFSCSLIIIINSIYGVKNSKKTRQIVALLMEASPREIFWKITLMDALPQIAIGMRTSLSLAVIVVIATEMFIGTDFGIGYRIFETKLKYSVLEMYAYILIAGFLGYILNKGFIFVENKIVHWSGK